MAGWGKLLGNIGKWGNKVSSALSPWSSAIGLGTGLIGMLGSNRAMNRSVRNGLGADPSMYDSTPSSVRNRINFQGARNINQEAMNSIRASGIGVNMGDIRGSSAMRGAGRNTYGKIGMELREREKMRVGQHMLGRQDQLLNQREGILGDLLGRQQQGRQFGIGMAYDAAKFNKQAEQSAIGQRGAIFGNLLGEALNFGGGNTPDEQAEGDPNITFLPPTSRGEWTDQGWNRIGGNKTRDTDQADLERRYRERFG